MDDENQLEAFRDYLRVIASSQIGPSMKNKIDASDIVQQTLVRAYEGFSGLRDRRPEVIAAWLRQILANEVIDTVRHFRRGKREVDREQNVLKGLDQSAMGLEAILEANHTSPSMAACRNEALLRLADALMGLPDEMRQAIVLKHLNRKTLDQVAQEMERTPASVAGLLRRGLKKLRSVLTE